MERTLRIIIIVVLAVTILNVILIWMGKSQLKEIQKNIELSQRQIEAAMKEVSEAKSGIDSVRTNLAAFRNAVQDIQTRVAIINTKKELEEAGIKKRVDDEGKELKRKLDSLENRLKETQPAIEIVP